MRITTVRSEKSLAELVRKVYKLSSSDDAGKVAAAEEALVKANPHLREFDKVRPGATVVVPDVEGFKHALPEGVRLRIGTIDPDEPLRRSLSRLKGSLGSGAERRKGELDHTLEALKSPALKVAIKENPELAARVEEITATTKKRRKELEEEHAERLEVLERLGKDLDEFVQSGALAVAGTIEDEQPKPRGAAKAARSKKR